jgi:hypothetical protein
LSELIWERVLDNMGLGLMRAQVFGGWLVRDRSGALVFVSDPQLRWEVETRPAVIPEPPRIVAPPRED